VLPARRSTHSSSVRALSGTGGEFEIVLSTDGGGLDVMTVRCVHQDFYPWHPCIASYRDREELLMTAGICNARRLAFSTGTCCDINVA
jgi:hypothetical protein